MIRFRTSCRFMVMAGLLSATPAFSNVIPLGAQVRAGGTVTSIPDASGQSWSAVDSFSKVSNGATVKSSYGSFLDTSLDSGIYSYVENTSISTSTGSLAGVADNSGGYSYQFHTTSSTLIDIDYSFAGNSYFTSNVISLSEIGGGTVASLEFATSSALASYILDANKDYVLSASLNRLDGQLVGASMGPTAASFNYSVFFSFSSATPELSSWCMMIVGLGLVGALLRNRQTITPVRRVQHIDMDR